MFNGLSRDFSSLISCLASYLRYLITVESDHVWSLDLEKPGTRTKSSSIIWALMLCRRPGGPFWNTPRSVWVWTQTHLSQTARSVFICLNTLRRSKVLFPAVVHTVLLVEFGREKCSSPRDRSDEQTWAVAIVYAWFLKFCRQGAGIWPNSGPRLCGKPIQWFNMIQSRAGSWWSWCLIVEKWLRLVRSKESCRPCDARASRIWHTPLACWAWNTEAFCEQFVGHLETILAQHGSLQGQKSTSQIMTIRISTNFYEFLKLNVKKSFGAAIVCNQTYPGAHVTPCRLEEFSEQEVRWAHFFHLDKFCQ